MKLKKEQLIVLLVNLFALLGFVTIYLSRKNYEFLIYVGVIIFFLALILFTINRVNYPIRVLWGLTVWSILHMSGGSVYIGETRLYELMLLPIVGEPYHILKYDQFVHAFGFAVTTLVMYELVKPLLIQPLKKWTALSIVLVMAGLGAGALNEIVEFFTVVVSPSTGVGGYENTALDLVANLVGAIFAMIYIVKSEKNKLNKANS